MCYFVRISVIFTILITQMCACNLCEKIFFLHTLKHFHSRAQIWVIWRNLSKFILIGKSSITVILNFNNRCICFGFKYYTLLELIWKLFKINLTSILRKLAQFMVHDYVYSLRKYWLWKLNFCNVKSYTLFYKWPTPPSSNTANDCLYS